jgi:ferritin-like metal-binding protein YciE
MAKSGKTLRDLFHDTLKDIYFAEKKIQNRREGLLLPDDTLTDLQKVAEEYGLQKLLPF